MTAAPKRTAQVFLIALLASALPAFACSVSVIEPLKYAFKQAPIVFEGTLVRLDPNGTAHFQVHRQWKGTPTAVVAVPNPPTSCEHSWLPIGERYIVVPEPDGSMNANTHIEKATSTSPTARLLEARASWWRSPLSSFTLRAILQAIDRRMP
jgi:hypothetical protein